jgi:hypothetical protein
MAAYSIQLLGEPSRVGFHNVSAGIQPKRFESEVTRLDSPLEAVLDAFALSGPQHPDVRWTCRIELPAGTYHGASVPTSLLARLVELGVQLEFKAIAAG